MGSSIHLWHEDCVGSRVAESDGDPLGITAAERLRVGHVGGESVTFGLTRHWVDGASPARIRAEQLPRLRHATTDESTLPSITGRVDVEIWTQSFRDGERPGQVLSRRARRGSASLAWRI
jgi:hypothetical protein